MRIERVWAMPSFETFSIKPISELLDEEMGEGVWIDPFARNSKRATITNDLDPSTTASYHMDALEFMQMFEDESIDGMLFDPPYSSRQVTECYNKLGLSVDMTTTSARFWSRIKKEVGRVVKPGGKVISFGWNTGGIGMTNGFDIERILLVPHGGHHYDTLVTVERKRS